MAFKREGDDLSQLNVLRKRRVADLLASYIPEDEAVLMRNGRYACSICPRRPVFDTVDMLAVHRRGRKHLTSLQQFYNNKRNLQLEVQKRQHQQHVRQEEGGPSAHQTRSEQAPLLAETRRITHHALRRTAPYSSCSKRGRPGMDGCSLPTCARAAAGNEYPLMAGGGTEPGTVAVSASHSETRPSTCDPLRGAPPTGSSGEQVGSAKRKRSSKRQDTVPTTPPNPERQRQLEHYLKLRSSGWIPDGCGKWIQDETVEFDSDEEEPCLLPPLSP
ncbi:sodium channel modifier 1 [Hemiscyllium ocellatum]|uniref:sodium channel modifier 1 n=1 Tax=Hemiscyllium ocellatum TaxID=170820 RepID=UPI002965E28E|nr:sodium channel modifier 1 [Hemiscyllium ocellatum]